MARTALAQKPLPLTRILLVEDNASDAFLVNGLLRDNPGVNYVTERAATQSQAVEMVAEQEFDVCLLDLTLPDASGFSALVCLQEKAPQMPVIILTGMKDTALAKRAVGRGAQDYLLKDEIQITRLTRAIDYAMERKRIEKELFQRANYDALTGLANREIFLNRLDMALARTERLGTGVAVLFIDLDRFKPVNDTYGHDAGDEVLRNVAQRIKSILRAYDTPARFGGDEFAVLLEGIGNARDAATIAQKIIRALSVPIAYQNHALEVGGSIGIAFCETSMAPETLLQQADIAMYHAKKDGGGYRFYAESMQTEAVAMLGLEEDLRAALLAHKLRLYYQPYVSPDGQAVLGVEALLRWPHPDRGLLAAHEFLPAAESARLMAEVAQFVCAQLRRDISLWNAQALPPMHIAANLSVSQLDAPDLPQWFSSIAQRDFLKLHRLAVEIPEEALTDISGPRFMALAKLHDMGIALHLDNFGRGSLPLTTLCSLPFSLLKLDMSLIKNMSDNLSENVLIGTAVMLAHHLGMKAGAVGVELPWQADMLKKQVCDSMQGFLTVHPMTADELVAWIQKNSPVK